jgi:hypothetical protein
MKMIESEFLPEMQRHKNSNRHGQSKPKEIHESKAALSKQTAPGHYEIIPDHGVLALFVSNDIDRIG